MALLISNRLKFSPLLLVARTISRGRPSFKAAKTEQPKNTVKTEKTVPKGQPTTIPFQAVIERPKSSPQQLQDGSILIRQGRETVIGKLGPLIHKPRKPELLTPKDVKEIRALRKEDPTYWSVQRLAWKFNCSTRFIQHVAHRKSLGIMKPAPPPEPELKKPHVTGWRKQVRDITRQKVLAAHLDPSEKGL